MQNKIMINLSNTLSKNIWWCVYKGNERKDADDNDDTWVYFMTDRKRGENAAQYQGWYNISWASRN